MVVSSKNWNFDESQCNFCQFSQIDFIFEGKFSFRYGLGNKHSIIQSIALQDQLYIDLHILGPNFNRSCRWRISFMWTKLYDVWKHESNVMV